MTEAGLIILAHGPWSARISAPLGGSLLDLSHAGEPVLRRASTEALRTLGVRAAACYPLVPYANRIAAGRLPAAGRVYALRANFPPEPHALHGVGWQRSWQVARAAGSSAELVLRHEPDTSADWPFAFEARQRFELGERGLTVGLSMRNRDTVAWPAGLGLHPNLAISPGQTLQFEAAGAWCNGPDRLPERPVRGAAWDFSTARQVALLDLDHDFYGWRGPALVGGGPLGVIRLQASEIFSVLRIFTPVARGFFAVEPATHIADAVHRPPSPETGYRLLEPGATLAGTVAIELEAAG
jgi:aldose 1-epimerase